MHLLKQRFLSQFSSCDPPISLMSNEEDGERIFHFFLFFLCPFSAHSSPLPQGGACQHPSGLNLPLVQILSLVCSHKSAAGPAPRLGFIPDLWTMERSGNEGGLSMQFLRKLKSSVHVKDSISWYISHLKPSSPPWQQGNSR